MDFDVVKDSAVSGYNSAKDKANDVYSSTKDTLMSKLPENIQKGIKQMNVELPKVMTDDYIARIASASGSTPADARSVLADLIADRKEVAAKVSRDIITLENLSMVSGMPPMGDNIVDPPPFINSGDKATDKKLSTGRDYEHGFSTGLCGMDYIERCIVSGQFLTLVPLELKPELFGNAKAALQKGFVPSELSKIKGRLGVASYGLEAEVASRRYWRTYTMLMKSACLTLGLDPSYSGVYTESKLRDALPKHIYETIIKNDTPNMFKFVDNEAEAAKQAEAENTKMESVINPGIDTAVAIGSAVKSFAAGEGLSSALKIKQMEQTTEISNVSTIIQKAGYDNFLKYAVNVDQDVLNKRLPIVSFFINGVVDRSYSSNMETQESSVARETTDIIRKAIGSDAAKSSEAGQAVAVSEEYLSELAFHKSLPKSLSFALANTSIPKVISGTATDHSFNVKVTEQAVGSDPASLIRVMDLYCKVVPFVTPVSDGKQNTVVPQSPLYCAAFVKGVMNVTRGAITSVNIQTNPAFQTSEGIPTVMDVTMTIQPLLTVSAIPDMGRFFAKTDETSMVASMYNPMSAFNILATMCGYNTVLSKFPFSLFEYFVEGKIKNFISSLKGTGNFVHTATNDFIATRSLLFGQSLRTK